MTRPHLLEPLEPRQFLSHPAASTPQFVHTIAHLSQAREKIAATSVGPLAFFAGGEPIYFDGQTVSPFSDVVDIYDSRTRKWSTARLSQPRAYIAAVAIGDLAIFAGGTSDSGPSNVVDIYNARTGRWSTAALSEARETFHAPLAAAVADGKAYFIGGRPTTIDVYDPQSNQWSVVPFPESSELGASAASIGDLVMIELVLDRSNPATIDIYNVRTGQWSKSMKPGPADSPAAITAGNTLLFAGGRYAHQNSSGVAIFNAKTGAWAPDYSQFLCAPRARIAAATLGRYAFFAGGHLFEDGVYSGIDIYDSVTGAWSTSTLLSTGRSDMGATSIGNSVFFAGGEEYNWTTYSGKVTDTVDIYTDPSPAPVLDGSVARASRGAASVSLKNFGDAALPAQSSIAIYAATSLTHQRGAVQVGSLLLPKALEPGASIQVNVPLLFPRNMPAGNLYLLAAAGSRGNMTVFAATSPPVSLGSTAATAPTPIATA